MKPFPFIISVRINRDNVVSYIMHAVERAEQGGTKDDQAI